MKVTDVGYNQLSENNPHTLIYLGTSMNPQLRDFDIVHYVAYNNRTPKIGDIVCIRRHSNPDIQVIHRIVAITQVGIVTQGDNCPQRDDWILQPSEILGYINEFQRGNRIITVPSGLRGYFVSLFLRLISKIGVCGKYVLKYPYRYLLYSEVFKKCISLFLVCRAIQYSGSAKSEIHLYLGPLYIGRLREGKDTWDIKPPYRIFVSSSIIKKSIAKNCDTGKEK